MRAREKQVIVRMTYDEYFELKRKLLEEGLFDLKYKKQIPLYPFEVTKKEEEDKGINTL